AMEVQLESAVHQLDERLLPALALLGDVTQIAVDPTADVEAIEASFRPDRTADLILRILALAVPGSLAFAVEDAEWADDASSQLLQRLAQACATHNWLMLVTRRDETGGFVPDDGARVNLEPLPADAIEALVIAATASEPLRPHEIDLVVRRSGGNPLFAEEIIRAGRDAGSFDAVPESLEAAIATQADTLDKPARRVLRYATALGSRFDRNLLEAVLASEGRRLDRNILPRLNGFLIQEDDGQALRFRNDLVRTTIYESLAYRLRGRLHGVAAETLEKMAPDVDAEADNLARHFHLAGRHDRVWHYALIAANLARRAYANPEAASLYELALDASRQLTDVDDAERAEVWRNLGEVREWAGMFDQALDAFRRASRLVKDDPVAHAGLLIYRAHARERAGAFPAALRELTSARKSIQGLDAPLARKTRAKIESFTAMIRFAQEHYGDALKLAEAAVPIARAANNQPALAEALVTAGSAQQALGKGNADHLLEALAIYERTGDLSSEANVRGNLGCVAFLGGHWDEALEWFETNRDICMRTGNVAAAATAASNIGEIMVKRHRFDAAEPVLRDAYRVMRASNFNDGAAYVEIQLARILVDRGESDEAIAMMERVAAEFTKLGQLLSALEAVMVQSLALTKAGDPTEALALLDKSAKAAGDDARLFEPQIAEARARALAALERLDDAHRVASNGLTSARNFGLPYEETMLLQARIDISTLAGQQPEPQDLLSLRKLLDDLGVESTPRPSG
ncbi:MAG: hypothetical protein KJO76_09775, partial [Gammaproteobacteria bacterium]|nr:hypothetical protein [Gammaproteobacteria bacterium]